MTPPSKSKAKKPSQASRSSRALSFIGLDVTRADHFERLPRLVVTVAGA